MLVHLVADSFINIIFLAAVQANHTLTADELERVHISSVLRYAPDNKGGGRRRWSFLTKTY